MNALIEANSGIAKFYGEDEFSLKLQDKLNEIFEKEVIFYPAVSVTATKAVALAALTPSYGKIFYHDMSHINTDECGAPEFFTAVQNLYQNKRQRQSYC